MSDSQNVYRNIRDTGNFIVDMWLRDPKIKTFTVEDAWEFIGGNVRRDFSVFASVFFVNPNNPAEHTVESGKVAGFGWEVGSRAGELVPVLRLAPKEFGREHSVPLDDVLTMFAVAEIPF